MPAVGDKAPLFLAPGTESDRDVVVSMKGEILLAYQRVGAGGRAATVLTDTRRLRGDGYIQI
jgi:hypothetical protein